MLLKTDSGSLINLLPDHAQAPSKLTQGKASSKSRPETKMEPGKMSLDCESSGKKDI
jgi:hypothetical protein